MDLTEVDCTNRAQVTKFLDLPFRVYRDIPQWVPLLARDARHMLDRRRHPFYQHSEAAFFLANNRQQQAIGRIAVLNNRRYNQYQGEKTAFFYLFECENDPETAQALFQRAFEWAHERRLERALGPRGFTVFDGLGMLVKGFEHRPAFGLPYNPPYYVNLVESAGFMKESELVSGYLDRKMKFPEDIHRASEVIQKRRGLHIARFTSRRDLRSLAPHLQELYNSSLGGTVGNVPLTDGEVKTLADQLIWFADPKLIKIVMKDEQPVGFLFAYPDLSAAMRRSRGKLFPTGWLILLLELKRTKWINVNGAGMTEKYRGLGGTAVLFSEMYKSIAETGYEYADLVQVGVENDRMQRELAGLGIDFYKTHRVYQRCL